MSAYQFNAPLTQHEVEASNVLVAVCVFWPEYSSVEKLALPAAKRVVAAYSFAVMACMKAFGGYSCEKYKSTRIFIFPTVRMRFSHRTCTHRLPF